MAPEISDKAWDNVSSIPLEFKSKWHQQCPQFLAQHNSLVKLLDSHATLLAEMHVSCAKNSTVQNAVQKRLSNTEVLIFTFNKSAELLADASKHEEQVLPEESKVSEQISEREILKPRSKMQKITEKSTDPSGLFMVDPTPTPLDKLMKEKPTVPIRANEGQKRKARDDDRSEAPAIDQEKSERKIKKPKKKHSKHSPVAESTSDPGQEHGQGADDAEEEFAKAVEARIQAKEGKRKAKAERKRKRSTNDSMDIAMENRVAEPNKKVKGNHMADNTSTEAANRVPAASNGAPASQKKEAKLMDWETEGPATEEKSTEKPQKKHSKDDLADNQTATKRPHNDGISDEAPAKRARKRKSRK
jgi:hypothetical protein